MDIVGPSSGAIELFVLLLTVAPKWSTIIFKLCITKQDQSGNVNS